MQFRTRHIPNQSTARIRLMVPKLLTIKEDELCDLTLGQTRQELATLSDFCLLPGDIASKVLRVTLVGKEKKHRISYCSLRLPHSP